MSAQPESLPLAADFPAVTRDRWRELVAGVLRKSGLPEGADPEAALSATTYDGIPIAPLYTAADAPAAAPGAPGRSPFVRGATADGAAIAGWDVRQRHADPDPARTRDAALADLTNGATSLWLVLGESGVAVSDLGAALDGVYLDLAPVALDAGAQTREAAAAFLALADERGVARAELAGTLGADPIGLRARTGRPADPSLVGSLAQTVADAPNLRVATVDATVYHDAGAGDADEIGIATAVGVAYLRALTAVGLDVDAALERLEFRLAVSADQFAGIAKLRAARRVWARVAELSGATGARGQRQHAVTSAAMMTRRDPWVNLLRTTIACFAAAVGGAEAITVAPFDAALGLPDDFARRIARNTQSILHDESSLARVVDAAGGSWYVESLTDALAEKAWATFTAIERAGGALAALDDGTISGLVAATRAKRADDVAHRRAPITGVSEFALVTEEPVVRAAAPAAPTGGPLAPHRWAEDFEALRDRTDTAAAATGTRPAVFLAALGPYSAHSGRVGFAANLFQAAGLSAPSGTGDTVDDVVAAFRASGSPVACLCSSDKVYADQAAPAAAALKAAGAQLVWLAGQPGDRADSDAAAGVDGYVFVGCDALTVLRTTLDTVLDPKGK